MPRIAYLGPEGTFTEAALMPDDGSGMVPGGDASGGLVPVASDSTAAALATVRAGDADYACVPIENSIEGSVLPTLDSLADRSGAADLRRAHPRRGVHHRGAVRHHRGARPDGRRVPGGERTGAATGWQPICRSARLVPANSNAAAADDVAEGRADAGVSTALAAQRYGLAALAAGVVDEPNARTRFVLVGPPGPPPPRTGADRTSVVLRLDNVPGALVAAMTEFAIREIDLTRIESRPTRNELGTYIFFLDCVGHIDDDAVAEALKALHRRCADVRYLGSWPTGSAAGAAPPQLDEATRWLSRLRDGETDERAAGVGPSRPVARQRRAQAGHPPAGQQR